MSKHPSDVILEAEAIVAAARRFAKWKAKRAAALEALVLTYCDDDAVRLLAVLREEFWSES